MSDSNSSSNTEVVSSSTTALSFAFEGHRLTFGHHNGRPCVIAQEVGEALGYDEGGFRTSLHQWSDELIDGVDYEVLSGVDLKRFQQELQESAKITLSNKAHRITVLYESGVNLVCLKTEKPLGKKLRRFLADEVMPKLMRGQPVGGISESRVIEIASSVAEQVCTRVLQALALEKANKPHNEVIHVIGKDKAEAHILSPLRQYARQKAWSLGLDLKVKKNENSIRSKAEQRLRKILGFATIAGAAWASLPEDLLPRAVEAIQMLLDEVRFDLKSQKKAATPDDDLPIMKYAASLVN